MGSFLPWNLGSLRVFCFEGIPIGRFPFPGGSLFTGFSSLESLLVLPFAVTENITTTLEHVSRAPQVSHAFGEGSRQGRKGQDTACLWGGVPGVQPRPLLSSWWDLPSRWQGGDMVELSHCFGKLKSVHALIRGNLSALLSFLLSTAGLTRFSFIGTSQQVCFLLKIFFFYFDVAMLEKHTPAPSLNAVCKLAYVKPHYPGREHGGESWLVWGCHYLTLGLWNSGFFASWLPGTVPWLCPPLHKVRADPVGFALFLAPCPAA